MTAVLDRRESGSVARARSPVSSSTDPAPIRSMALLSASVAAAIRSERNCGTRFALGHRVRRCQTRKEAAQTSPHTSLAFERFQIGDEVVDLMLVQRKFGYNLTKMK